MLQGLCGTSSKRDCKDPTPVLFTLHCTGGADQLLPVGQLRKAGAELFDPFGFLAQLVSMGCGNAFKVRDAARDSIDCVFDRRRPPGPEVRCPFDFAPSLVCKFVSLFSLLPLLFLSAHWPNQSLLSHGPKHRGHGTRGGPPPSLARFFHAGRDFSAALGRLSKNMEYPDTKPAMGPLRPARPHGGVQANPPRFVPGAGPRLLRQELPRHHYAYDREEHCKAHQVSEVEGEAGEAACP